MSKKVFILERFDLASPSRAAETAGVVENAAVPDGASVGNELHGVAEKRCGRTEAVRKGRGAVCRREQREGYSAEFKEKEREDGLEGEEVVDREEMDILRLAIGTEPIFNVKEAIADADTGAAADSAARVFACGIARRRGYVR